MQYLNLSGTVGKYIKFTLHHSRWRYTCSNKSVRSPPLNQKKKKKKHQTNRMATKEKRKWNKRTQCSAIFCKNYQCDSTDVAFHRFPKDPER